MRHRRHSLALIAAGLAAAPLAPRPAAARWFPLVGDDGRPVENLRLPVELRGQIESLRGVLWLGAEKPEVTLIEFFDFNCPYCRTAMSDIAALMEAMPGLQVGLVNNPILSPMSAQAAKAGLAVLALRGPATAYRFHRKLFAQRGAKDGAMAIRVAETLDIARSRLVEIADGSMVQDALGAQMRLAAALMLPATPSFVIGTAGILGYPGPSSLARMIAAVERCGEVVC